MVHAQVQPTASRTSLSFSRPRKILLRASAGCLHRESKMRGAEVQGSVDMVVIGHVGVSIVHAGMVSWTSAGGSGYAVAASAAALIGRRVGLVAQVGTDFDLAPSGSVRST
jgi:hypothetical protein